MKLILNAFAYITGYESGANLGIPKEQEIKRRDTYLKNSCLSLTSAKRNNPDCDVALCTNLSELPFWCNEILEQEKVKIMYIPFDKFMFNKNMKWSLAFYKLCALQEIVERFEYDSYCLIDVDCYVNHSLKDMWIESENNILMYNTFDTFSCDMRQNIISEFQKLYPEVQCKTFEYYAGGEIAGSRELMKQLLQLCTEIWERMQETKIETVFGDEFFWFTIDKLNPQLIKPGNAYFEHYWTYKGFFLISTNYHYHKMPVLHFPSEKDKGLIRVYEYYIKNKKLPEDRILWHLIGLPQPDGQKYLVILCKNFIKRLIRKNDIHK